MLTYTAQLVKKTSNVLVTLVAATENCFQEPLKSTEAVRISKFSWHQVPDSHLLAVPSCPKCSFTSRAFCVSLRNNWNSLPLHIRSSDSLATFQSRLKSHLFASAYHV